MLKRLEIAGFKSFARKTVLDFSSSVTAIVGPNGSGKCVIGDTLVQLASGEQIPIRALFDRAAENARTIETYDDGVAITESGETAEVAALDLASQTIVRRPVAAYVRRISPEKLLTITTRSGRSVTATPYHPLFTLSDGAVTAVRADALTPGVRIAAPRRLPVRGEYQRLSMFSVLNAFRKEDAVYIPYSQTLVAQLQHRIGTKSAARMARTTGVASKTIQGFMGEQALPFSAALQLFAGEDEAEIFPTRQLKSRTWGFVRIPEAVDETLARFLGYLIAAGRNCKNGQIRFVNDDPALVEDFVACAMRSFNLSTTLRSYKGRGIIDAFISSIVLSRLLDRVFGITQDGHSRTKAVPAQMFASPDSVVAHFLSALFESDGHFHTPRPGSRVSYVEYATASKRLAEDVASLLLRFGITAAIRCKEKRATNGTGIRRPYWSVFIYGADQLAVLSETLTLRGRKRAQLAQLGARSTKPNPNLDLIPGGALLVRRAVQAAGLSVKRLRKEYPTLAAYMEGRCEATRPGISRCLEAIARYGTQTPESEGLIATLRTLIAADVLWDEIVSVEERAGEEYVYDLCVAEDHNFIAGNLVVHNSNVAEAFRFALGEQSMKSMRGKRSEDLIWSGSNTIARANRAAVSVVFDNRKRIFPKLDFDEVSIERAVFRDGQSEYSLNGSKVRLRDVQEQLASANIGDTGHHIISQGEADRILLAHPRERRAMLEDALGLKSFEFKKQEAAKKLEKTQENVKQVEALRRELVPHLKFLGKQVEKLERAEELIRDLIASAQEYLAIEELYIKSEKESNVRRLAEAKERLATATAQLAPLQDRAQGDAEGVKRAQAVREAERELDRVSIEHATLSREIGRVEGALDAARKRKEQLSQEPYVKIPRADLSELKAEVELTSAEGDVTGLRAALASLKSVFAAFFERFAGEKNPQLTDEEAAVAQFEKEREVLARKESSLREAMDRARSVLTKAREASVAYEETGRESQYRVLEIAEAKAHEETNVVREEARGREMQSLAEEFERDRAEVLALAGSAALSYKPLVELPAEERRVQEDRKKAMERLKIRVEEAGGTGEDVRKEFEETGDREAFLARELLDLEKSMGDLKQLIADLDEELTKTFTEGLTKVNASFGEFFALMFGGGSARLILEEPEEVDEEEETEETNEKAGIEIAVALPKKRVQSLMQLSGGERALTSIALIFAMSQVNPPPFLILDETDAALDEANSRRYGDMIENLARRSQLVVITHNRETMSRAGVLYGVTMGGDGVSKLLSVKFEEAVAVAK